MAEEKPEAEDREFENFLKEIAGERKFTDTLLDGSSIDIILVAPHAADATRAAALVDQMINIRGSSETSVRTSSTAEILGKIVRLACVSCIKGVKYENVMAFLDRFPPNPPIVGECLRLLGITDQQMQKVGIKSTAES